jgi:hypothetical protein
MFNRISENQTYGIKSKELSNKFEKKNVNKKRDNNYRYCYTADMTYNPK